MDTENICPSCQKRLPANAPKGLCPECLMKAGFGTGIAPEPGQPSRTPKFIAPPASELAKLFPQFEILELLGQGGMGAVYKARQPALDRLVALKILPPQSGSDSGFADRFTREARALARLSHPNIVTLYEFGQAGGLHYFVMEYVDGLNLRQLQQRGKLAPREALRIIPQICDALQFAHDEGIVHRDIKPENVMLDRKGRVKIADFGLARILGRAPDDLRLTGAQDVMGTPHYMAPEQVEHPQDVDHRADIYSLGVVFYEMLTGELPLGRFQPPSKKVQVDVRLDEVVLHALEKEPERRYQQAGQVKTDVETIAATPAPEPAPKAGTSPSAPAAALSGLSSNAWKITAIIGGLGVALLLGIFCVLLMYLGLRSKHAAALVTPAPVAAHQDIEGTWEGTVNFEGVGVDQGETSRSRVVLRIVKKGGEYSARADVIDCGFRNLPVSIDYTYASLRLRVNPQIEFEGKISADGTELDFGETVLRRTSKPDQVPEKLSEAEFTSRAGSALQGYWKGLLGTGPDALPLSWKIAEGADGTFRAELDNPMQGALGQPTQVVYKRPTVKLVLATRNGMFQGEINTDNTELKGSWVQGGQSTPATFMRGDYQAEHAQDALKDYSFRSENDLQGHWEAAFILRETPVTCPVRLALDIAKLPDGTYSTTVASIYHLGNNGPRPTSEFRYSPPNLHMAWKWMQDRFEGELKSGKIAGTWIAGGAEFPLVFERQH
jgi:hypothetical protein